MRNQPVTPSKDNPIFFLWNAPSDLSHKNWRHPNTRIIARTFCGRPDAFTPAGYTSPSNIPQTTGIPVPLSQLSGLATAAALVTAHIFHANGLLRGYGSYNGGNYDGGLFIQNWGYNSGGSSGTSSQPGPVLVGHPSDRIPLVYRAANTASTSGLSPYRSYTNWTSGNVCDITLIMTSGITECSYYSQVYFSKLKEYCDAYTDPQGNIVQLCYPKFIINDTELLLDNLIYYRPSGAIDIGHRLSLHADPRYSTSTIYQIPSGVSWQNVTMSGAEVNLTLDLNPLPTWFAQSSSGFIQWWYRTAYSALSYANYKGLYEPAVAIFPEIKTSNYKSFEVPSGQFPHVAYLPRNWERVIQPVVREDYNSPAFYPGYIENTGTIYTISTKDDYENSIHHAVENDFACIVSGYSTKPTIPWIMGTGALDNTTIYINPSFLASMLKYCYDSNVSEYIMWGNPSSSPVTWTDDAGYKNVEYFLNYLNRYRNGNVASGFTRKL